MRVSLSFITGTTPISMLGSCPEWASGGPHILDALGYSPAEHKLYLLEHYDDESGDLPQLHCMHTRGTHIGRMVPVHRWYEGDIGEVEAKFESRLARLCERLRPLEPAPSSQLRLATRVIRRRALRLFSEGPPIRKFILRLTVRPVRGGEVTSIGAQTTVTAYLRPRAHLSEVMSIPGERLALAIVSYVGLPYELGFEKSAALLVPLP